jgi:hypothetical protein
MGKMNLALPSIMIPPRLRYRRSEIRDQEVR